MRDNPVLEVAELPTDSMVPYANNAKLHSALQIEQIANSIQEFGFNDPIAVWENGKGEPEIVEGHGRVLAAKKLGIDKIPVIYLNHLSDRARRAYTHIHNQTTLNSGFDISILDEEMAALNELADFGELEQAMGEFDWVSFGFDEAKAETAHVDEVEPPEDIVCRAKRGDVWQLGDHRVMCGDASDLGDMAILVAGGVRR